jgi:polyisoprenyl-phosphate glycosyltransferase
MPRVSIIVPVLNEADNIFPLYAEVKNHCPDDFELLWVDDGSTDTTLAEIQLLAINDKRVKCLSLSKNFGHQNALIAGINYVTGDYIITMDGDLQHPPSLIPQLIKLLDEGNDIVFTKRDGNGKIPLTKKLSSTLFYKIINFLSDINIAPGSADFRAFNNKVLKSVKQFEEREIFLRGIFSWVGFKNTCINFTAPERKNGVTKYSYNKMLRLALKGTTSFSFKPLRLSLMVGALVSLFAFAFAIFALISYFNGVTITGWASIIIAVMLLGGIQLLVIGLLGEYIAGMFIEIKKRPVYLIKDKINI